MSEHKTVACEVDSISLKWGTLKSWDIHSDAGMALLNGKRS